VKKRICFVFLNWFEAKREYGTAGKQVSGVWENYPEKRFREESWSVYKTRTY
jgi:hypothetical protein